MHVATASPTCTRHKIVQWPELLRRRDEAKDRGQTVVWTNGCFDLLHMGHVCGLQGARALGDLLVVGLNSDESVQLLKGRGRPILPAGERAGILSALACVDYVIVFEEATPERAIARMRPDIHCKGADYEGGRRPLPEAEIVEKYGGTQL